MKMLFLIFHGFEKYNGISKKIDSQLKAFKACGVDSHICYLTDQNNYKKRWIDNEVVKDYGDGLFAKIKKRVDYSDVVNYVRKNRVDFVYVRHDHNANPILIHLFKEIRKCNCSIILEIPTYPYDQEYNQSPLLYRMFIKTDQLFRKRLMKYVDRIVTFTNEQYIFGVKTITISNGIDFSTIPVNQAREVKNEIHCIGVAEIHYWHGFDRFLRGLGNYYKKDRNPKYKVFFHVVGTADEKGDRLFQEIIQRDNIEEYVIFYGRKFGNDLDDIFAKADMGIGSLGRHRSGISSIKTLKNREYAARGIPFCYSECDDDFDEKPYTLKYVPDESDIDIDRLVDFYTHKRWDPQKIRNSIEPLSWKNQIEKIVNYIEQNEKD